MIINFPEQIYTVINKPVYMHCVAKGHPLATHKWTKDNWHNLNSAHEHRIFENGTLLINSVQRKNKGEYRCQASNDFGHDTRTLVLYVQGLLECQIFHLQLQEDVKFNILYIGTEVVWPRFRE